MADRPPVKGDTVLVPRINAYVTGRVVGVYPPRRLAFVRYARGAFPRRIAIVQWDDLQVREP